MNAILFNNNAEHSNDNEETVLVLYVVLGMVWIEESPGCLVYDINATPDKSRVLAFSLLFVEILSAPWKKTVTHSLAHVGFLFYIEIYVDCILVDLY